MANPYKERSSMSVTECLGLFIVIGMTASVVAMLVYDANLSDKDQL